MNELEALRDARAEYAASTEDESPRCISRMFAAEKALLAAVDAVVASGDTPQRSFTAIQRTDGEEIYGDFQWISTEGNSEIWEPAVNESESWDDEPIPFALVRMSVETVETRSYLAGRWVDCDQCAEGPARDRSCSRCAGSVPGPVDDQPDEEGQP